MGRKVTDESLSTLLDIGGRIVVALRAEDLVGPLRSFAPSSPRGLAKGDFHPFGSTFIFLNDELPRVITCFATCGHEFRRDSRKEFPTRASIWCIFTVKIRGTPIELTAGGKTA